MREMEFQVDISCHQMKFPILRVDYIQLNCWSKGSYRNPQTTQAIAKTVSYSPQTDSKSQLLKGTPTQVTEYGEVRLVLS